MQDTFVLVVGFIDISVFPSTVMLMLLLTVLLLPFTTSLESFASSALGELVVVGVGDGFGEVVGDGLGDALVVFGFTVTVAETVFDLSTLNLTVYVVVFVTLGSSKVYVPKFLVEEL